MVKGAERPVRSANAGELSRDFAGRVDVRQYYSGALRMKNYEPVPQGGFRLMAGTVDLGPARHSLMVLQNSGASTSNGPHTGTQTVFSAQISGAVSVVHWQGVSVSAGTISAVAEIDTGGGNWIALGPAMTIGATSTSRTFAVAPGKARAAVALRIRATFSQSATLTQGTTDIYSEHESDFTWPRYRALRQSAEEGYFMAVHAGFCDIFQGDAWVATVKLSSTFQASMLPDVGFYAEQSTFGIFHPDYETRRLRRVDGNAHEWSVDLWPYKGIPTIDYGDDYPKTDDEWEVFIRWSEHGEIYLTVEVDGESTPGIPVRNSAGEPTSTQSDPQLPTFAAEVETEINNLPSIGSGASVAYEASGGGWGERGSIKLTITFGDDLSGREFNVVATIVNRASASALAYHTKIGETEFEPIMSSTRGWPGRADLVQDRLAYSRFKGQPAALALSQAAEYFTLNVEAVGASAARLDRLRNQTSETILATHEQKYLVVFTDQNVWFATNRALSAEESPNFVIASEVGIRANCEPVDLQGETFYIAANGRQILGGRYDELETGFVFVERTIINSHLVEGILRTVRQVGASDTEASRMWILREDGRLIQGQVITSQEIFGLAEWVSAGGDPVKELASDNKQDIRLCISRNGKPRHERLESTALFQQQVTVDSDLAGLVTGLPFEDGAIIWANVDEAILGPFICNNGQIDLGGPAENVEIGRWQAPVYEDMPHVHILPNDEVVWRPGRIHTVTLNVIDTTSIAIGANGEEPENLPLLSLEDEPNKPMPPKTGTFTVSGITGAAIGSTIVITQTRPGRCRVRDYSTGERL